MAAFSFSAPRFTDEMMEAEKNAMTEEHRNRIEAEVYGLETSDRGAKEETSEMMAESLESFQSHLDSIQHKPTYLQAVDKCPELFETESAPIRFLRAESYDTEVSVLFLAVTCYSRVFWFRACAHTSVALFFFCRKQHKGW